MNRMTLLVPIETILILFALLIIKQGGIHVP